MRTVMGVSVDQPWAFAVATGARPFLEQRAGTRFRGTVAICATRSTRQLTAAVCWALGAELPAAGARFDSQGLEVAAVAVQAVRGRCAAGGEWISARPRRRIWLRPIWRTTRAVIGLAELTDVYRGSAVRELLPKVRGRSCWMLTDARLLCEPIPLFDSQPMFELPSRLAAETLAADTETIPAGVVEVIASRLRGAW